MARIGWDRHGARWPTLRTAGPARTAAIVAVLALGAAGCGDGGDDGVASRAIEAGEASEASEASGGTGAGGTEGLAAGEAGDGTVPPTTGGPAGAGQAGADLGRSTVDVADLVEDYGLDPANCTVAPEPGATAAITCDFSPITYELVQLADAPSVAQRFDEQAEADGAEPRPWWYADAPGTVMGEMYTETSGGRSIVRWTNARRLVVGLAWQEGDDPATLAGLQEWWSSDGSTPAPEPG